MDFIFSSLNNVEGARGLVVVIDVLRAFTTACYLFENKVKRIIPVDTVESAFELKKRHPDYILVGEKQGWKISGFDYDNSPTEIKGKNFLNKTVIMLTSTGTKGIMKLPKDIKEIITASFVNCRAVSKYIKSSNERTVYFVCTDNRYDDNEDYLCAQYIKNLLEGKKPNFKKIKNYLINHPTSYGFLKKPLTKNSRQDFDLCLELDKFNFVIKAHRNKNYIYLAMI